MLPPGRTGDGQSCAPCRPGKASIGAARGGPNADESGAWADDADVSAELTKLLEEAEREWDANGSMLPGGRIVFDLRFGTDVRVDRRARGQTKRRGDEATESQIMRRFIRPAQHARRGVSEAI